MNKSQNFLPLIWLLLLWMFSFLLIQNKFIVQNNNINETEVIVWIRYDRIKPNLTIEYKSDGTYIRYMNKSESTSWYYEVKDSQIIYDWNEWNIRNIIEISWEILINANWSNDGWVIAKIENISDYETYLNEYISKTMNNWKEWSLVWKINQEYIPEAIITAIYLLENESYDNVYSELWINLVKEIQKRLLSKNYDSWVIDGIYWQTTTEAVKSFQEKNWLEIDWLAGQETLRKLFE